MLSVCEVASSTSWLKIEAGIHGSRKKFSLPRASLLQATNTTRVTGRPHMPETHHERGLKQYISRQDLAHDCGSSES